MTALDDLVRLWRSQCLQSRFGRCAMPLKGWSHSASSRFTLRRTAADIQCFCTVVCCVNTSPAPVSLWNLTLLPLLTPTQAATTTKQKLHRFDAENWKLMWFSFCVHAGMFSAAVIHLSSSDLHFYWSHLHMTSHLLEKARTTFTAPGCTFQFRCDNVVLHNTRWKTKIRVCGNHGLRVQNSNSAMWTAALWSRHLETFLLLFWWTCGVSPHLREEKQ